MNGTSDPLPRWLLRCLQVLGATWTLPNSLLGLLAGAAALAGGAHAHWRGQDLALVFHRVPWGKGGALTLGNVILHTGDSLDSPCLTYAHHAGLGDEDPISIGDHERAHVFQYMVLGPLFLPLYFAFGGISVRNRFERSADRYAQTGCGWWPFRRTAS